MIKNVKVRKSIPKPYNDYVDYINKTLLPPKQFKFSAIDLFAGCGGLSLGFEAAGIKTYGYEMLESCCETYNTNLSGECSCEMLSINSKFPAVDIVIGGPPCQPFSVSGKQQGKEDKRNGFPIFIEAVRQTKPKVFLFENVRGVFYRNKEYFESVIEKLSGLGYNITYELINAADYDVPQNRERVICVGTEKGYSFPAKKEYVVTAGEAVGDIINILPENPMYLTESMDKYIASYEKKSCCKTPRDLHLDMPARTLTCRNLAGATSDMHRYRLSDGRRRRLEIREAARLQSFPDWFKFSGDKQKQYNQIGNAVPPMLAYNIAKSIVEYLEKELRNGDR